MRPVRPITIVPEMDPHLLMRVDADLTRALDDARKQQAGSLSDVTAFVDWLEGDKQEWPGYSSPAWNHVDAVDEIARQLSVPETSLVLERYSHHARRLSRKLDAIVGVARALTFAHWGKHPGAPRSSAQAIGDDYFCHSMKAIEQETQARTVEAEMRLTSVAMMFAEAPSPRDCLPSAVETVMKLAQNDPHGFARALTSERMRDDIIYSLGYALLVSDADEVGENRSKVEEIIRSPDAWALNLALFKVGIIKEDDLRFAGESSSLLMRAQMPNLFPSEPDIETPVAASSERTFGLRLPWLSRNRGQEAAQAL